MVNCKKNDSRGSLVSGFIILGVGLYLLGVNTDVIPGPGESWPIFPIIVGAALIVGNLLKKKPSNDDPNPPPGH